MLSALVRIVLFASVAGAGLWGVSKAGAATVELARCQLGAQASAMDAVDAFRAGKAATIDLADAAAAATCQPSPAGEG